ncbi:A-kinase anchor protein 200 [Acyrthosiphon pisum]|uniref:Uncharacterized protein n=1 Tax=Acyrthosiphon pisum TaxID=7029 RepID=A0A8R2D278_ACYPI|nr:A-kinase anchor protein 200 [Acyrthosiphon pisum]|eukprot:XP_016657793.1 PREDICTED: uncharacterized protein LOC107883010 [Acyrthosiphon pisum]
MVVALQIVCVSAVFCGALHAAPTVTYDQRQQGEFNVQVDVDDVAIILLASEEFAQRAILQGNKMQQIFSRHNGVKSKKKHHKKPVNCSTMVTANPEVPYSSESPTTYLPTSSQGYEELYSTSSQDTVQGVVPVAAVAPVFENVPADLDGQKTIASHASYSEATTPSAAQDAFEKNVDSAETAAGDVAVNSSEMVAVKTVEKPAVDATVETNNITENAAIETVDKSADATTLQALSEIANGGSKADIKTDEILSTNFEEKPVSISSDVKTVEKITNDETVKINETPENNTEDKSYENTTVKIVETVEIAKVKPAEMVVVKTIEKPKDSAISEGFVEEPAVDASRVNVLDSQVDTKTTSEPTEMIAMKPVEKPTSSEVLKVVKKPVNATDTVKAADTSITTSVDLSKSSTEMVAMKTMENPLTAVGPTDTIEKSGITTNTKLVEIQEDTKKQSIPSVENNVSRSAPKQTEMIAVKTMENSATVKSVISVKTVIKPGIQKSTHSSNSSLIMRKVGDRKPLPTITLEVATPKVL